MKKNILYVVSGIVLFILGAFMIYLGMKGSILPPAVTGIGFIIIGLVFISLRRHIK